MGCLFFLNIANASFLPCPEATRRRPKHSGMSAPGSAKPSFVGSVFSNYVMDFTKPAISDLSSSNDGMSMSRAT